MTLPPPDQGFGPWIKFEANVDDTPPIYVNATDRVRILSRNDVENGIRNYSGKLYAEHTAEEFIWSDDVDEESIAYFSLEKDHPAYLMDLGVLPDPPQGFGPWIRRPDHPGWPSSLLRDDEQIAILTQFNIDAGALPTHTARAANWDWSDDAAHPITHYALVAHHPIYMAAGIKELTVGVVKVRPEPNEFEAHPLYGVWA